MAIFYQNAAVNADFWKKLSIITQYILQNTKTFNKQFLSALGKNDC